MVRPLFVGNETGLTRVATTQAVDLSVAVDPFAPAAELLSAHRPRPPPLTRSDEYGIRARFKATKAFKIERHACYEGR